MSDEQTRIVWIEERTAYTADELATLSGLPRAVLDDLVACGALSLSREADRSAFAADLLSLARTARRLRDDFDLDHRGLAVAISLTRRIRILESRLGAERASPDDMDG